MKTSMLKALAIATLLAAGGHATAAGQESLDIETRFRAKIAKEKVKQSARERELDRKDKNAQAAPDCGSQNIGVIDTNDRPGTAPREVFVFAPNAINLVNGKGCQ